MQVLLQGLPGRPLASAQGGVQQQAAGTCQSSWHSMTGMHCVLATTAMPCGAEALAGPFATHWL